MAVSSPAPASSAAKTPPATPGLVWSSNTTGVKTSAGDPGGNWTAADPNNPSFFFNWNPTQGFSYSNLPTGQSSHDTVGSTPGSFSSSVGGAIQQYEGLFGNAPAGTLQSLLSGTTIGSAATSAAASPTTADTTAAATDPLASLISALPGLLGSNSNTGLDTGTSGTTGTNATTPTILPTTTSSSGSSGVSPIVILLLVVAAGLAFYWWRKHHGAHAGAHAA